MQYESFVWPTSLPGTAGYQTTEDKPLIVKDFEPTGQGPSNAGLVGMPARRMFVEQAADPEELVVDEVELDEVELDEVELVEVELEDVELDEVHH